VGGEDRRLRQTSSAELAGRGLVTTPRNNSFDLVTLFTVYTAAQGIATALVTRAVAAAA
jgi:hypothetical protein